MARLSPGLGHAIDRGAVNTAPRSGATSRWARVRRDYFWPAIFVGPAVLGFLLLRLTPIVASFLIGLTDWRVAVAPNWVGLDNFRKMFFADPLFWKALSTTLLFTIGSVPLTMAAGLGLALLINQRIPLVGVFRTIFYLPSIMPVIATSVLWLWIFNPDLGLLNAALQALHLPRGLWIYGEASVLPSLILVSLMGIGPMMVIFLAGLQGVPRDLYEAVEMDGGGVWRKFRDITLPMLTPTILFNLIIFTIGALQTFIQDVVMTQGGPNNASLFFVYYVYRTGFQESSVGYASALSWVLFVVTAGIGFAILGSSRRWVFYYGDGR